MKNELRLSILNRYKSHRQKNSFQQSENLKFVGWKSGSDSAGLKPKIHEGLWRDWRLGKSVVSGYKNVLSSVGPNGKVGIQGDWVSGLSIWVWGVQSYRQGGETQNSSLAVGSQLELPWKQWHICKWNSGAWSKCIFPNNFYLLFKSILASEKPWEYWPIQSNIVVDYYVIDSVGGITCAK